MIQKGKDGLVTNKKDIRDNAEKTELKERIVSSLVALRGEDRTLSTRDKYITRSLDSLMHTLLDHLGLDLCRTWKVDNIHDE